MPDTVEITVDDDRWVAIGVETLAEKAVRAALRAAAVPESSVEVSLLACGDQRMIDLNATFRQKPDATNVLSWPALELSATEPGASPAQPPGLSDLGQQVALGDIAISYETCLREALESRIPLEDHAVHLIVHGCLHLLGYDHVRDADATVMEALEVKALANLGISNPYG